ncbi:MAG TPA: VCBS repeat-containing protein [Desulfuromonadales bacterium]|nr:VCBS repeat-containing protein [Desulfuromonadales bacterium]
MKKPLILITLLMLLTALPAAAAPLRLFVTEINAVGVQNRDEMKQTLQTLLASRLNGDTIASVGSAAEADIIVSGSYISIGKVFSVDALAKNSAGKTLARSFVQGDKPDELIPAIGKLAEKLAAELNALYPVASRTAAAQPAPLLTAQPSAASSDIIKSAPAIQQAPKGEFIKPAEAERTATGSWLSKRLEGAANLLAVGKTLSGGDREIFLAEERRLSYYRQGSEMKLVSETKLNNDEKIVSLDTIEGSDGSLDIYVTMIRADEPSSQVWQIKGDKLVKVAEKLPWFFRSFSLAGGAKKLYAQAMGRDADFYGDVSEVTRSGSSVKLSNPVSMPRYGNIYSYNQFRAKDGTVYSVVINPDGYLLVYDKGQKELWRSNDKFGGSELYFQKEDPDNVRVTGDKYRWIYMNHRIQVTTAGDVLVGKNDGFWVLGNARSYKKGAVFCMAWNGSSLEEKWRTRDTQNYLPDYTYDEARNELLLLQTVQRPGVLARGASSLSIKRVE